MSWCRLARATPPPLSASSASFARPLAVALGAALFAVGCGGSPPSPQAPAVASGRPVAPTLAPAFELGPVAAPPNLVMTGRVAKPNASLATLRGWSKLPMPQSAQATEALLGEPVGALVDLDQAIDFALAIGTGRDPKAGGPKAQGPKAEGDGKDGFDDIKPRFAVSAALLDPEAAKAALSERYKLVRGENGALVITGMGGGRHHETDPDDSAEDGDDTADHETCEIAPAYGPAAMRLVCAWGFGRDPGSLADLGPWLTRGATRAAATADLHVDLRMQPLKTLFGDRLKMILSLVDGLLSGSVALTSPRELVMGVLGDLGDFFLDLDSASLDIDLSDPVARAVKTLTFSSRSSALTRLAVGNADRNAPPPAVLWQMPADSTFAFFERGIDAKELGRARELLLKALADQLADDGVKPADRTAIVDALGHLPPAAPLVYAAGMDGAAIQKALATLSGNASAQYAPSFGAAADAIGRFEALRSAILAGVGWHVVEVDEPAAAMSSAMNALVLAWSRPGVVAAYRSQSKLGFTLSLRTLPLSKRTGGNLWPKDTFHYALELAPPKDAVGAGRGRLIPQPIVVHALLVPDGGRTWVGIGSDEALMSDKLAAAMSGSGETLGGRAELAPLRAAVAGSGGFISLRGLMASAIPGMTLSESKQDAVELFGLLAQLPHQGTSPVGFWTAPQAGSAPSAVTITVEVPRGAIEDLIGAVLQHGGF